MIWSINMEICNLSIYIMSIEIFIEQKAKQLAFYANQLRTQKIPFNEVKIFAWDILEEWNKLDQDYSKISDYEQVFWNLLYLVQCWPEEQQSNERSYDLALSQCCDFLTYKTNNMPLHCIGVRP